METAEEEVRGHTRTRVMQVYLDDGTAGGVRGMAEMTLIKLGEIVDKPQHKRVKMMQRAIEEQRAAREAQQREKEATAAEALERQRQNTMSAAAHEQCVPLWRTLHAMPTLPPTASEAARELHRRLRTRGELPSRPCICA